MMTATGIVLMVAGAVLGLLSGVGVVRLPTSLARIHAAAKPASLGLAFVATGAGITAGSWGLFAVGILVAVFQFVTAPVAGHLLGRSVAALNVEIEGAREPDPETPSHAKRSWPLALQATVVWVVLWRDLTPGNVLAGLVIGVALTVIIGPRQSPRHLHIAAAAKTLAGYLGSLVLSNFRMAQQIVRFRESDLTEVIVTCDLETRSTSVALFDANAISFSPGTLTLEVSENPPYRMVVHALGQSAEDVGTEISELEESAARMYE